jgi:hypothetical protein
MRGFIGSPANMEHFPMEYLYELSDIIRSHKCGRTVRKSDHLALFSHYVSTPLQFVV